MHGLIKRPMDVGREMKLNIKQCNDFERQEKGIVCRLVLYDIKGVYEDTWDRSKHRDR